MKITKEYYIYQYPHGEFAEYHDPDGEISMFLYSGTFDISKAYKTDAAYPARPYVREINDHWSGRDSKIVIKAVKMKLTYET